MERETLVFRVLLAQSGVAAAEALAKQLRVTDICLMTAAAPGETVSREGTL